jgi:hypothetical protein
MSSVLSEREAFTLESAKELVVFSEFPLGLVTVGSHTDPLACATPIAYRPLVPLTRAMQLELVPSLKHELKSEVNVTIAECVSNQDLVGRLSRAAWRAILGQKWTETVKVRVLECNNLRDLKAAIARGGTDVLIVSAHGYYDRRSNKAGMWCGNDLLVDEEIGPLPPLTILSACQVWPRATSPADVASLLLRQGSLAVIGTLVRVDVRHSSRLMMRFLANIADVLEGGSHHRTIQDVWHHTMSTDAINCILNSNNQIARWAHEGPREESVVWEFMMRRSTGRLRRAHIYEDTEEVLLEIARDRNVEQKVRTWLARGYVRESLFYAVLGWPERIMLPDSA